MRRGPSTLRLTAVLVAGLVLAACAGDGPGLVASRVLATPAPPPVVDTGPAPLAVAPHRVHAAGLPGESVAVPAAPVPSRARKGVPIGSIEIPKIAVAQGLYEGIDLPTLKYGPGHWPGTPMPGDRGNSVVAGHRVTNTRPFRRIDELVPGDQIVVRVADRTATYEMVRHWIVDDQAMWITDATPDDVLTFFACHPPGSAKQRYVVRAKLVSSHTPPVSDEPASPASGGGSAPPTPTPKPLLPI